MVQRPDPPRGIVSINIFSRQPLQGGTPVDEPARDGDTSVTVVLMDGRFQPRSVASVARVKAMVDAGIPVQGHIGLTPQNMSQQGGYKVQGRTESSYRQLLKDALALQDAGAFSILLEAMPPSTALKIKNKLKIPAYGIGAGDKVDGQLVIIHDIIGLFEEFTPKFVKKYCDAGTLIENALSVYAKEVRTLKFPSKEHFYDASPPKVKGVGRKK